MSVIAKARGLLALAAVLLLPTAEAGQAAQPEPLVVVIQKAAGGAETEQSASCGMEVRRKQRWIPHRRKRCRRCRRCAGGRKR